MDKKFDFKQIGCFLMCAFAGISAYMAERDNQRKEAKIEELEDRISKLEEAEEES